MANHQRRGRTGGKILVPIAAMRIDFLAGDRLVPTAYGKDAPAGEGGGKTGDAGDDPDTTTIISPLPAAAVGRMKKYGLRPLDGELVTVRLSNVSATTVDVTSDAGSVTLDVEDRDGTKYSKKKLLFWYGSASDLGSGDWDDIATLEVTKAGDVPFSLKVKAKCSDGCEAELNLVDVLIEDPATPGTFRTMRYGFFKTRTPHVKLVLPGVETAQVKVVLDDGDETTDDELNVTSLVNLSGDVTDLAQLPGWITLGSDVTGVTNTTAGRGRAFVESEGEDPATGGDNALFLHGENRLLLKTGDGDDETLLFVAHSFHYLDDDETIPAGHHELLPTGASGGGADSLGDGTLQVAKGCIALDFKSDATAVDFSNVLFGLRLRPRAFAGKDKIVQGQVHADLTFDQLVALRQEIEKYGDEKLESLCLSYVGSPDTLAPSLERIPVGLDSDYDLQGSFNNAQLHWHHFVIHTFPAHRLIETIAFPDATVPSLSITGGGFDVDKTFVHQPGDELQKLLDLIQNENDRKVALFGHNDRIGNDARSNGISLKRAQALKALLRHDVATWFDRFGFGPDAGWWPPHEIQWLLKQTGDYSGPINGNLDQATLNAVVALRTRTGAGPNDAATRSAYVAETKRVIGAAANPDTTNETAWSIAEIEAMLFTCGDYTGPIDGNATDKFRAGVKHFKSRKGLGDSGYWGVAMIVELIREYMNKVVPTAVDEARFFPNAVFGCGEAFPHAAVAAGTLTPLNRRVDVVMRQSSIDPIDPATQVGAAVRYRDWLSEEQNARKATPPPSVVVGITDTGFGNADNFNTPELLTQLNDISIKGERWLRPTDCTGATAANRRAHTVNRTGDLRNVRDPAGHGSSCATCLGADGVGSSLPGNVPRNFNTLVLGTAPHVKIRPVRISKPATGSFDFFTCALALEILAADPDVTVMSTSSHLYYMMATPAQFTAVRTRLKDFASKGKVVIASAGNYRNDPPGPGSRQSMWDTATRQFGSEACDRNQSRQTYTGGEAHRQNVMIVGSSQEASPMGATQPGQGEVVALHSYLGEQVNVFMPGENIRLIAPSASGMGIGGAAVGNHSTMSNGGTSFATPMTAGVVAELMVVDPDLKQAANVVRALEYVEATADPIADAATALALFPGFPRSAEPGVQAIGFPPPAGAPAAPIPTGNPAALPTVPATYGRVPNGAAFAAQAGVGNRRVHFWKAVLAAANKGLAAEGRGAGPKDAFFQTCDLITEAATKWYGFEIRSFVQNSIVWFKRPDGRFDLGLDGGALPAERTRGAMAVCWQICDQHRLAPPPNGAILPAYPWTLGTLPAIALANGGPRREYFMCQLSVKREKLQEYQSIVVHMPGVDPRAPGGPSAPPILELRVDDAHRPSLRTPAGAGAGTPEMKAISTLVEEFDDFVIHATALAPIALSRLHHFVIVVVGRSTGIGTAAPPPVGATVGVDDLHVVVYAVDEFGFLTPPPPLVIVNFSHNGTAGAAAPANAGVFLSVTPAAGAAPAPTPQPPASGIPLNFGANNDPPCLARARFQAFTVESVTLKADDGAHTGTLRIDIGAATAATSFSVEIGFVASPHKVISERGAPVASALTVTLTARDSEGRVATGFSGDVTLTLVKGDMGGDGPPPAGVHLKNNVGDPFDATQFTRHMATGAGKDNGVQTFTLFGFTPQDIQLQAQSGAASGQSPVVTITPGNSTTFKVEAPTPQTLGNSFNVSVTAVDAQGNRVTNVLGQVTLSTAAGNGTAPSTDAAKVRHGVWIGGTVGTGDDSHDFTTADQGVWNFPVTCYTAENVTFTATFNPTGGGAAVVANGTAIAIQAGAAIDHFRIEANGAGRVGTEFELKLTAVDANDNVLPGFTGNVTLRMTQGTPFKAAPPADGVRIRTSPGGDAGSAAALAGASTPASHNFVAADNGVFSFWILPLKAETIQFQPRVGAADTGPPSAPIAIAGGIAASLKVTTAPGGAGTINVTVTAMDGSGGRGNVATSFTSNGIVQLQVRKGGGAFAAVAGQTYQFTPADAGTHTFANVPIATHGNGHKVQAADSSVTGTSPNFNMP